MFTLSLWKQRLSCWRTWRLSTSKMTSPWFSIPTVLFCSDSPLPFSFRIIQRLLEEDGGFRSKRQKVKTLLWHRGIRMTFHCTCFVCLKPHLRRRLKKTQCFVALLYLDFRPETTLSLILDGYSPTRCCCFCLASPMKETDSVLKLSVSTVLHTCTQSLREMCLKSPSVTLHSLLFLPSAGVMALSPALQKQHYNTFTTSPGSCYRIVYFFSLFPRKWPQAPRGLDLLRDPIAETSLPVGPHYLNCCWSCRDVRTIMFPPTRDEDLHADKLSVTSHGRRAVCMPAFSSSHVFHIMWTCIYSFI